MSQLETQEETSESTESEVVQTSPKQNGGNRTHHATGPRKQKLDENDPVIRGFNEKLEGLAQQKKFIEDQIEFTKKKLVEYQKGFSA